MSYDYSNEKKKSLPTSRLYLKRHEKNWFLVHIERAYGFEDGTVTLNTEICVMKIPPDTTVLKNCWFFFQILWKETDKNWEYVFYCRNV